MTDFPKGCRSFFVREICEPEENSLRVVIVESSLGELQKIPHFDGEGCLLYIDEATPSLELFWEQYVSYSVENESFHTLGEKHSVTIPVNPMLQQTDKSEYLDYIAKVSFASVFFERPLIHWLLFCERHIVNVVSVDPPILRWIQERRDFAIR